MIETKITLETTENQGRTLHDHDVELTGGVIRAGTYRVQEEDGHDHAFTLEEDVQPGEAVTIRTTANGAGPHDHELTVRAAQAGGDDTEEDRMRDEKRTHKPNPDSMETKRLGGRVVETKEQVVNGVRVGVIEGYIATWSPDTGGVFGVPDQFAPGAFADSLAEHRSRSNRQIRLKDLHGRVIGGFPIETAREDDVGLRAVGHINLETQLGSESWALIKQGVLTDLSIGFTALEDVIEGGIRTIFRAIVWEGSVVDEPANRDAMILEFRSALPFHDLPIADHDAPWDPMSALNRVRDFAAKQADPDGEWKKAFVHAANGSLMHAIVDVVGDRLVVIPKAVQGTAESVMNSDFEGKTAVVRHLERYLQKMGLDSPFPAEDHQFIGIDEAKSLDEAGVSDALRRGAAFSKGAARLLASRLGVSEAKDVSYGAEEVSRLLDNLSECKRLLQR